MEVIAKSACFVDPMVVTGENVVYPASYKFFKQLPEPIFRTTQNNVSECPKKTDMYDISVLIKLSRTTIDKFATVKNGAKTRSHFCSGTLVKFGSEILIVTCNHNIENSDVDTIIGTIGSDKRKIKLTPILVIPDYDLAILSGGPLEKRTLDMAVEPPLSGDFFVTGRYDQSSGRVGMAKGSFGGSIIANGRRYHQIDAAGNDLMSGGPIIYDDTVVGVYNPRAGSITTQTCFFVPLERIIPLVAKFKNKNIDLRSWGTCMISSSPEHNAYYGNTRSLKSYSVNKLMRCADINGNHSSSSYRSTLEDGDNIISVNDVEINAYGEDINGRTFNEILDRAIIEKDTITILVNRAGAMVEVNHHPGARREAGVGKYIHHHDYEASFGGYLFKRLTLNHIMSCNRYMPHLWANLEENHMAKGVVFVSHIDADVHADGRLEGIQLCAILRKIDSEDIHTVDDLKRSIATAICNDSSFITLSMEPGGKIVLPIGKGVDSTEPDKEESGLVIDAFESVGQINVEKTPEVASSQLIVNAMLDAMADVKPTPTEVEPKVELVENKPDDIYSDWLNNKDL